MVCGFWILVCYAATDTASNPITAGMHAMDFWFGSLKVLGGGGS